MSDPIDEGRKRTIAVVAGMFLCRKLAALDGRPRLREKWRSETIDLAVELMRRIDQRWSSAKK